jgi:hypothetical protein
MSWKNIIISCNEKIIEAHMCIRNVGDNVLNAQQMST